VQRRPQRRLRCEVPQQLRAVNRKHAADDAVLRKGDCSDLAGSYAVEDRLLFCTSSETVPSASATTHNDHVRTPTDAPIRCP
jgi:hypothetical protein